MDASPSTCDKENAPFDTMQVTMQVDRRKSLKARGLPYDALNLADAPAYVPTVCQPASQLLSATGCTRCTYAPECLANCVDEPDATDSRTQALHLHMTCQLLHAEFGVCDFS